MLGVILCGGQSSRMGTDKGLLKLDAKTWTQTAFDKLAELNFPIIISINDKQHNDYVAVFNSAGFIIDDPALSIHGPLSGVLSVHLQHPAEDLLIIACDMPLMKTELLRELLNNYEQHPSSDAFVYSNDGEPEPLCGIYTARGLAYIHHLYQSQQLPKHSMKFMLEHINTFIIPLVDDQKKFFRNFNAHAELNGL
jgi:molybdopterin-guanine dinucleotide biosynthesis protein A